MLKQRGAGQIWFLTLVHLSKNFAFNFKTLLNYAQHVYLRELRISLSVIWNTNGCR